MGRSRGGDYQHHGYGHGRPGLLNIGKVTLPGSVQVAAGSATTPTTPPPKVPTPRGEEGVVPASRAVVVETVSPEPDSGNSRPDAVGIEIRIQIIDLESASAIRAWSRRVIAESVTTP